MPESMMPPPDDPLPDPRMMNPKDGRWHPFRRNPSQEAAPLDTLLEMYTRSWNLYHRLLRLSRKIQLAILLLSALTSGGLLVLISNDMPVLGAYIGSAVSFVVAGLMGYREIYKLDERIQIAERAARQLGRMLGKVRGAPDEVDQRRFWAELKDAEGDIRAS